MFGFGKDKHRDLKADFAGRIANGGKLIDQAVTAQLQFAVDNFDADLAEVWEDAYTRYYVFGAYDALTCDFPLEVRQKVGPSIIEMGFVQFATTAFGLSEAKVRIDLKNTFALQAKHPTFPAIIEGGHDGMEARQGRPALRLLAHLFEAYKNPDF
ncbi:hypothetical protein [Sphingomonas sp.]|uniref:hypothetical protein n=1 Tax=Sphingomonas sp. TaxID=28214 RepID=UPI001ECF138E|nr:hypothetical protein [Sphingomonas sp.]MBX3593391.1 hypothetical protein [Sphingomonas sp.]